LGFSPEKAPTEMSVPPSGALHVTKDCASYRTLLEAASLAARAHDGQMRKDKETPYVSHVFRVCLIVRDLFGFDDPSMLKAALLHDTIEDTNTDFDDIADQLGHEIAAWVAFLTKNKAMEENAREADYIERLLKAPWQVQACKLADVFDNLIDLPNLPAERRPQGLRRAEKYLNALKTLATPELRRPLALVQQLLDETRQCKS
jgi:guanosine-3',5'-bis(diphosphate) 3'-pyrophosphohydrolase